MLPPVLAGPICLLEVIVSTAGVQHDTRMGISISTIESDALAN